MTAGKPTNQREPWRGLWEEVRTFHGVAAGAGARHRYYLELKRAGYFDDKCPGCGGRMTRGAGSCLECWRNGVLRLPKLLSRECTCGRPMMAKSRMCLHCAGAMPKSRRKRPVIQHPDCPYCEIEMRAVNDFWHCPGCGLETTPAEISRIFVENHSRKAA